MVDRIFDFYKKKCGIYNRIFIEMKLMLYFTMFTPITIAVLSIVLAFRNKNIWITSLVTVVMLAISKFLLFLLNKKARDIVIEKKYSKEYKGAWNNTEVLQRLKEEDKKELIDFLDATNQYDAPSIERLLKKTDEMLLVYKPKFPVVPAFFAGLIITLYSACISWIFDKANSIDEIICYTVISLGAFGVIFVILKVFSGICRCIQDIYSKDYHLMLRMRNIIDEILFDITKSKRLKKKRSHIKYIFLRRSL